MNQQPFGVDSYAYRWQAQVGDDDLKRGDGIDQPIGDEGADALYGGGVNHLMRDQEGTMT